MKKVAPIFLTLFIFLSACSTPIEPTPTATPITVEPARLVISEVLTGSQGNNPHDFIELYNAGDEIADLKGHSLWYQLKDDTDEILIYRWNQTTLVPPHGHYLLTQEGQDFEILPDAQFNQSLVPGRGGLALRSGDETIDSLAWGSGPQTFSEGSPAPSAENDLSLERLPGSDQGNSTDTNKNTNDFTLNTSPSPQSTGSPPSPAHTDSIQFSFEYPATIVPGSEFEFSLTITNQTGQPLENINAFIPLPDLFTILDVAGSNQNPDNSVQWSLPELAQNKSQTLTITLQAPWTFTDIVIRNVYVQAKNWSQPAFIGPIYISISGGAIPVATARQLIGSEVVVEGVSTMYSGGFFAGSGAKFYLEDETGGLQVYIAGAGGSLNVPIGALVRVRGLIEPYRGALELIPASIEDIEIIGPVGSVPEWTPELVSIDSAANDTEALPGRLVQVEGLVARLEEFTYSYEMDITNEQGDLVTLYIDKETGITIEAIESGHFYQVTGIIEIRDDLQLLNPRLQSDLTRIYPPGLVIEAHAPTTALPEEAFTISLTVFNHAPDPADNLIISLPLNDFPIDIISLDNSGYIEDNTIFWQIPQLEGNGTSTTVSLQAQVSDAQEYITISNYTVFADQWPDLQLGDPTFTFISSTVPIWAIQGPGTRSPYILKSVQTQGLVTAVFPELEGFWIQEINTDDDPLTSSGVFVQSGSIPTSIAPGDLVDVSGLVREFYQQTQITPSSASDIEVISTNNLLPPPVALDPPTNNDESLLYFEALEGMLVQVQGPAVAVGPTSRYGEFAIILPTHNLTRVWQHTDNGMVIRVDDGSTAVHDDQSSMLVPVSTGDQISNLVGPLSFTFGNYKIQPTEILVTQQEISLPTLPKLAPGQFSIMTWNVENLFDFTDPHPSSPPMPTVSEYNVSITKVANTILSAGAPTIIGFQEVENIGILEDIAAHELLTPYQYIPVLIEGDDSRGIDVGYLVRGDQAAVIEQVQYPAPGGLTSRPPLLLHVQLTSSQPPLDLYMLNNHFTSMSGGELATEPRRNAQAAWNITIMEDILAQNPDALLAVIGDLNSYYYSLPIDTLRSAGLQHVLELLPEEERYTYIYQGISQVLDHILVTQTLMELIAEVNILHTNADYTLPQPDDLTPLHKSDHDPLIATFTIP